MKLLFPGERSTWTKELFYRGATFWGMDYLSRKTSYLPMPVSARGDFNFEQISMRYCKKQ